MYMSFFFFFTVYPDDPCRIQERHAVFRNEHRRVTLTPMPGSKVVINGTAVSQSTELRHLVATYFYHTFMPQASRREST